MYIVLSICNGSHGIKVLNKKGLISEGNTQF